MKNYNKKIEVKLNIKQITAVLVILALILSLIFIKIIHTKFVNYKFSKHSTSFVENNEQPIFKINKLLMYSSAGVVDKSAGEVLQDLDISQYTDISISIDNKSKIQELTDENTVKELYIDNIKIENSAEKGERILNYKNPYLQGKFKNLENCSNNRIDFKILTTNQESDDMNYDEANFYTDCSNPISLGYVNKNIITRYAVSEKKNSVSFDGTILKNANVDINDINAKISFQIHIKNNKNQEFVCSVILDDNLDQGKKEIYKGYVLKAENTDNQKFNFVQIN